MDTDVGTMIYSDTIDNAAKTALNSCGIKDTMNRVILQQCPHPWLLKLYEVRTPNVDERMALIELMQNHIAATPLQQTTQSQIIESGRIDFPNESIFIEKVFHAWGLCLDNPNYQFPEGFQENYFIHMKSKSYPWKDLRGSLIERLNHALKSCVALWKASLYRRLLSPDVVVPQPPVLHLSDNVIVALTVTPECNKQIGFENKNMKDMPRTNENM